MATAMETVKVKILDKDYQVACPAEERQALVDSARHLDEQMRAIRKGGKVIGIERIAVMAALNITHELLQQTERADQGTEGFSSDLQRLSAKLDDTIDRYRQIEL